jgi:endonuclease YncB( thermonuclease family)
VILHPRVTSLPAQGGAFIIAAAVFAAGLIVGAVVAPGLASRAAVPQAPAVAPASPPPVAGLRNGYPAEVLRVMDGDTFEARVRIWPGTDVTTRVRIRGIDAPEMKARCEDERVKAVAARDALALMLEQGAVAISNVGQDKYGGRVDADVSTRGTASVADSMLSKNLARAYDGGRRESWCD